MRLLAHLSAWLRHRILATAFKRPPDFIIGDQARPYLLRWWLIPRNRFFNLYLHEFRRSDDDRAHHGHPWLCNASWVLAGGSTEHTIEAGGVHHRRRLTMGAFRFRWGASPHRIELAEGTRCWTLFFTGPRIREWGFYCPERGWVHWRDFTAPDNAGAIGPGCDAP